MKVLVTGGSGFVGRRVVAALLASGHSVRVLARGTRARMDGVEVVQASVLEPEGLVEACRGCEVVVHLVGIISEVGDQTYERVHVDGTRHLLEAARAAGVRRWVQMSALGARPEARARYQRSKAAAEALVRSSGLAWTILRPSIVYGVGDGFLNFFERMSRWSPVLPLIGGGRMQFQPIAVDSVARCFAEALVRSGAIGRSYDLCGLERVTLREVMEAILRVTGRRRWLLPVPWAVAGFQAAVAEWVFGGVLRRPPPLNRDQLLMLMEDNIGDPGPMRRELGVEPGVFREGLGFLAAS
jgi:NADH dehydrogenase